jgi:4,5-dihydroxyphthalate decarboxylase
MPGLPVTLHIKDYEHLAPLASGDVKAEDIDLTLARDTAGAIDKYANDESLMVGEISFSKHLARLASGDRSMVGIPVFPTRVFRHRAVYVKRGSPLRTLKDLEGKRLGIDQWLASGSTWSRAAMREQGVDLGTIRWVVWSQDGKVPSRPITDLHANVRAGEPGRGLRQMLLDGELDALVGPEPAGLMKPDSPIVRMISNYRDVERDYYKRTGIYPAHHIIGIRRPLFEKAPYVARSVYLALEESKQRAHAARRRLMETSPWIQEDIEDVSTLMGEDWFPYGVEKNQAMTQAFCDELLAQGFIKDRLDGSTVFTEFDGVMAGR